MDLTEIMQPVLQHEAEQLVLAVRENLLHVTGDEDRFRWLQRIAASETVGAIVSNSGISVTASGSNVRAEERGDLHQAPAPFLRPALASRAEPFRQALGAAMSQAVADTLARRR
jgi:hypothetical protein